MTRTTVTPFKRRTWYWARIPQMGQPGVQRSLGTTDRRVALAICTFLVLLRERRESMLLERLGNGTANLGEAYNAYFENRLDVYIARLREGSGDTNLEPYVELWKREALRLRRPRAETIAKYERQVRTLIRHDRPFPKSKFTPTAIREWLTSLHAGSTNRYRAALSSFATYLVESEVIAFNPVLQVKAVKEPDPRTRYLDQADAQRLIGAIAGERERVYHALAAATAMERQALINVRRRDIDLTGGTVLADGKKSHHRGRTTRVYDRWTWAWKIVSDYLAQNPLLPDTRLFEGFTADRAYDALKAAVKALELGDFTSHDWRHTWAVQALRDGISIQTIVHQLGHKDPVMTLRVYGRFIPVQTDFAARNVTYTATATTETHSGTVRTA